MISSYALGLLFILSLNILLCNSLINVPKAEKIQNPIRLAGLREPDSNTWSTSTIPNPSFWKTVASVTAISGPLGTLLDNQHGLFHTLEYTRYQVQVSLNDHVLVKTAVWVPFLFSFAGFVMSALILILDNVKLQQNKEDSVKLSGPKVLYGISFFASQYYVSGLLDSLNILTPLQINVVLSILAWLGYWWFDGSRAGLILAALTAVAGPVVEIGIINILHIYYYTNADFYGICSWIPAVYFLGGQAVGNLTRIIYRFFQGVDGNEQSEIL